MSVEISIRVTLKTPTIREASVIICKNDSAIQFAKAFSAWLLKNGFLNEDAKNVDDRTKDRMREMGDFLLYLIEAGLVDFFKDLGGNINANGMTVERIIH